MLQALGNVLVELAPWLLLGMTVAGLLHGLLPENFVSRQLRGSVGVLKAVLLGVPLPLCSCGVIPTGLGLKRDGASDGASLAFLISTPQTGVDSILVSSSFLGWPFAIFKVASASIMGLAGGWVVEGVEASEAPQRAEATQASETSRENRQSLGAMVGHALDLLRSIWRWLVVGVVVSAAIEAFVPPGTFAGLSTLGPIGAGLAVLVISLPLYICATASVPIAAALVAGGMPTGAALVFLMAGPATNVATIGAILHGFGARTTAIYLATIIIGSVGLGALFDVGVKNGLVADAMPHHGASWWAIAASILLVALIARFAFLDLRRWVQLHWPRDEATLLEIPVSGLRCGNCVDKLEGVLRTVDGVDWVRVTRSPDKAVLRGSPERDAIEQAIREAGFQIG